MKKRSLTYCNYKKRGLKKITQIINSQQLNVLDGFQRHMMAQMD
ncbi:hypothetical protein LV89_04725 [Arcicella aurantiaca]|uniref:Uncharacterized protein n=1 Tax=Arcicella aurantiaca TaxID=591202 RepID=A0A316DEU1_9BACT|nr:hypothetical protein LV89_04725 [Arcicella aurantiaca]